MVPSPEQYIQRAIDLSLKGLGHTQTNPLVGCVIVHNNRIIGEGYHKQYGGAHAEVEAIQSVSGKDCTLLKDATLYVTLEPCCHQGKTPPCTELILQHQIPHVVIAMLDPYPKVSGKGLEMLKQNGVKVDTGVLKERAEFANRRFICNQEKHRPYVILKWAETSNGFMSGSKINQKQISGSMAQTLLHKWRSEESAFMIGKNTLLQDKPLLNNRLWTGSSPARIVLGSATQEFGALDFFSLSLPTFVIGNQHKISNLNGATLVEMDTYELEQILTFILNKGYSSVVVEGGRKLLDSFIQQNCWDEIRVLKSKKTQFESGIESPDLPKNFTPLFQDLKEDTLTTIYNSHAV